MTLIDLVSNILLISTMNTDKALGSQTHDLLIVGNRTTQCHIPLLLSKFVDYFKWTRK